MILNLSVAYWDRLAFRYLKPCQTILDIGCGQGRFVNLSPKRIIGLDSNPDSLKLCRQKDFKVKLGSVTKIPFKANSFSGINCSHVLEHLQPHQTYQALKEMTRVLKPGGILVIRAPLLWSGFYDNLTHIKPYSPQAISRYLVETAPDTTYPSINPKYKQIGLHWRYRWFEKNGYLLALKKNS